MKKFLNLFWLSMSEKVKYILANIPQKMSNPVPYQLSTSSYSISNTPLSGLPNTWASQGIIWWNAIQNYFTAKNLNSAFLSWLEFLKWSVCSKIVLVANKYFSPNVISAFADCKITDFLSSNEWNIPCRSGRGESGKERVMHIAREMLFWALN